MLKRDDLMDYILEFYGAPDSRGFIQVQDKTPAEIERGIKETFKINRAVEYCPYITICPYQNGSIIKL